MDSRIKYKMDLPFMLEKNGIISDVNNEFLQLSGFIGEDLTGRPFDFVWNKLLRISKQPDFTNIQEEAFLFTKSLEAKCVIIQKFHSWDSNGIKYYITEVPNTGFQYSNQFLDRMIADNKTGIGVFTAPDFMLIKANQTYLNNFPEPFNTKEAFYGKRLRDIAPGFKNSHFEKVLTEIAENNQSMYFEEKQGILLNEKNKYWDYRFIPVSVNNEVKYVVVMLDNVTERVMSREYIKRQSGIIKQQNEKLEAIIENIYDALYVFDGEGNYVLLNKAAQRMYGNFKKVGEKYEPFKYFNLKGSELTLSDMPHARVLKGERVGQQIICVKESKGTKYFSISGTPQFDDKGKVKIGVICVRDITALINQSQTIRRQKERLEAIISSMSDGLEIVDNNMKITYLNQSAKSFFFRPNEKVEAGDSLKYNKYFYGIDGEEVHQEDLPSFRIFNKGAFQNYILTIVHPDKKIYASVNGSPVYDSNGMIKETVFCIRNITEQVMRDNEIKYHQEAALKAEREKNEALEKVIEMKDDFLSLISHELRTPLNVISTSIQAMNYICKDELSDKAKEYLRMIRQNTYRQLRLVNNLLDITRFDANRIKIHKRNADIVFLTKSIIESVYTYASHKGVEITFASSLRTKIIGIDDEKYERILLNLLSNAIKFTPEGKSIIVRLRSMKDNICIEVGDKGIGIPEDKIGIIFDRFGQVDSSLSRQAEGAGIGLSLVKRFVEALGGSISVKSRVNEGTTFTILLPNEKVLDEQDDNKMLDLIDNHLVQATTVEFSDIYL